MVSKECAGWVRMPVDGFREDSERTTIGITYDRSYNPYLIEFTVFVKDDEPVKIQVSPQDILSVISEEITHLE